MATGILRCRYCGRPYEFYDGCDQSKCPTCREFERYYIEHPEEWRAAQGLEPTQHRKKEISNG